MTEDDESVQKPEHGESMRKVTKEIFDISKNVVLIGGLSHFAQGGDSKLLLWISYALFFVMVLHIHSYIQGPAVGSFLSRRLRNQSRALSWIINAFGWVIALLLTLVLIWATDQAIEQVANAQAK